MRDKEKREIEALLLKWKDEATDQEDLAAGEVSGSPEFCLYSGKADALKQCIKDLWKSFPQLAPGG